MNRVFQNNKAVVKNLSETIFRLMEIFKFVMGQWRFLGDSAQEGESKKLYEYMQEPRFIEKANKQIFSYRPSEEQFDKYENEQIPPLDTLRIFRDCLDNTTDFKFSFNYYENYYRFSACDLVEFKEHNSMDIMVFTNNDAVIISTSLTSR